jgi:hypothetical protein
MPILVPHTRLRADTNVTLAAGRVSSWIDMVTGTRDFVQAVANNQPGHTTSLATLGGRAAVLPDGGDWLQYTGAAADYTFLHSAAFTSIAVIRTPIVINASLNTLYMTAAVGFPAAGNTGVWVSMSNTYCSNGTLGNYGTSTQFNTLVYPSSAWVAVRSFTPPGALVMRNECSGGFAVNYTYNNAPTLAAPDAGLSLMGNPAGRNMQNGSALAELVLWDRRLSDQELAAVVAWFVFYYGANVRR